MGQLLRALMLVLALVGMPVADDFPDEYTPLREYTGQKVWDIPGIPENEVDIGLWALIIAKACDSTIDVSKYLKKLELMTAEIQRMIAARDIDMVKFQMTRVYLYEAGPWNDYRTFKYDLDDPMGRQLSNRSLPTYIDTRKGNCVSMPTLFLALMERIDPNLPFFGVSAPSHLFCRFHDRQEARAWNVETTSEGYPGSDEWYIDVLDIPTTAIDSGTYMADLTKKEVLAELVAALVAKHRWAGDYETALRYADLMLKINPRSVIGLVQKGALTAWVGQTLLERIIAENRPPTADESARLRFYHLESEKYIDRARNLGWRPETREFEEKYLKTIEKAKEDN